MAVSTGTASVLGVGLYTVSEAGRIIEAPTSRVRQWVHKGLAPAPVHLVRGETTIISFLDLVSLRVVRRLRDRLSMPKIRAAEEYLRREWQFDRPFASRPILTDGRSVLVALSGDLENLTSADRHGQETLYEMIRRDLEDLTYGEDGNANSWRVEPGVRIRPDVQFGAPCIDKTRVPTRSIYDQHLAGDSDGLIAWTCGVTTRQVKSALAYERSRSGDRRPKAA